MSYKSLKATRISYKVKMNYIVQNSRLARISKKYSSFEVRCNNQKKKTPSSGNRFRVKTSNFSNSIAQIMASC